MKSNGLATASLVLGIVGFVVPIVASIAGIIMGHIAKARICKSSGAMGGGGVATAGLIVGYFSLVFTLVLVALSFAGADAAIRKARTTEGRIAASSMAVAVNNFYAEYNRLPDLSNELRTDTGEGVELLRILLAQEGTGDDVENPRGINFLSMKEGKGQRGGLYYGTGNSNQVQGLYDPFGEPYTVVLNTEYEDVLTFRVDSKTYNLRGEQVAIYSPGADGELGTVDDITSFQR